MKHTMFVMLILVAVLVVTCGVEPEPIATPTQPASDMPNPASAFCVEQGYESQIRVEAGGQVG